MGPKAPCSKANAAGHPRTVSQGARQLRIPSPGRVSCVRGVCSSLKTESEENLLALYFSLLPFELKKMLHKLVGNASEGDRNLELVAPILLDGHEKIEVSYNLVRAQKNPFQMKVFLRR